MTRPDFIDERASSGEIRGVIRKLRADLAYEKAILERSPYRASSRERIEAIARMVAEAAAWCLVLRTKEDKDAMDLHLEER